MLTFSKILVPLDLHEAEDCKRLVSAAVEMASKFEASLTFVNVVDVDLGSAMVDRFKDIKNEYASMAKQQLNKLIDGAVPPGIEFDLRVLSGRSYSTIVAAAEDIQADLVLISAHKPGMKEYLLGMTAARVVRHASCSVMVVRADK